MDPYCVLICSLAGIGGCLMSCVMSPLSISVGASGALMGLLGGTLLESRCSHSFMLSYILADLNLFHQGYLVDLLLYRRGYPTTASVRV